MSLEALNDWCSGHPKNQLERLKKEKACANKVYDILDDFKLFEILLDRAIREEIEMQNDPAIRIEQMLAMQMNPESLKETLEEIQRFQKGEGEDA